MLGHRTRNTATEYLRTTGRPTAVIEETARQEQGIDPHRLMPKFNVNSASGESRSTV